MHITCLTAVFITLIGMATSRPIMLQIPAPADSTITVLDTIRPSDGTTRFILLMKSASDSEFHSLGTMTVSQSTLGNGTNRVIQRVIVYNYGSRGIVVDTTLSTAKSLAPIYERTYKPSGIIFINFTKKLATGLIGRAPTLKTIHDTLTTTAFNSTDLDLVVRSLPLTDNFTASLPIYDPEFGGYRHASIHVIHAEKNPSSKELKWLVRVNDRQHQNDYLIDNTSRALLNINILLKDAGVTYKIFPKK